MTPIQPADPVARRFAIALLVAIVVVTLPGYVLLEQWLSDLGNKSPAEGLQKLLTFFLWGTGVFSALVTAVGVQMWHVGGRTKQSMRFPPPGMKVIRPTPILLGPQAVRRGTFFQIIGTCLIVLAAALLITAFYFQTRLH